jgi:hypothetical protein
MPETRRRIAPSFQVTESVLVEFAALARGARSTSDFVGRAALEHALQLLAPPSPHPADADPRVRKALAQNTPTRHTPTRS